MLTAPAQISIGNKGLDSILRGGLPPNRLYLVEGTLGSGKTTLALQFLRHGIQAGEKTLYITLSETREELAIVAASHGWDIEELNIFELDSLADVFGDDVGQSVLHSWEMEFTETMGRIRAKIDRLVPTRIVFDSVSEMRLLAQDALRFRRQVLGIKQSLTSRGATVLLVDDMTGTVGSGDNQLHSLCHGVISLERVSMDYGAARRRLQVQKLRGVDFIAGYHDFKIVKGGLEVYPRLSASDHSTPFLSEDVPSGISGLDAMLNGGPTRGTTILITGPAGSGKTTIALQYLHSSCERGEAATLYQFDERIGTLETRGAAFGLDIRRHIQSSLLDIQQIDPAEISPGEFAARVRADVEGRGVRMIVIDSLNGYMAAMSEEKQLILQMHELLAYLSHQGVVTFILNPQTGLMGSMNSDLNVSYIADGIILMRFFEADGRIRKAISVLKNRGGPHQDAICEFRIDADGMRVGEPLNGFQGVLTGTPHFVGNRQTLLEDR